MPADLPAHLPMVTTPRRPAERAHRVLVLGARGRFGTAAVTAFAAAGWQVLAQHRRAGEAMADTAGRVTSLALPLDDAAALAQACGGPVDLVVHALNPIYTRWEAELLPLARLGMAVAEALGASLLLPGNVYHYGAGMPARLDEDTPAAPTTRKGELRLALEQELADRARQGRLRSLVLRAGDFYGGSGRGSWLDLVIARSITQGKLVYPGPLDRRHAWAYLPDLASAAVHLAERQLVDPVDHQRLHFAGHGVDGADFLSALEAAAAGLGLSPARGWRHGSLPWPLLRAGGLVVPMWRELARMAYLWERPHALAGEALAARIGPVPATTLVDALTASLRALGHAAAAAPSRVHGHRTSAAAR